MDTFNITDDEIIECIVDCANSMNGENINITIKILIDFMQFKNSIQQQNIFEKESKK